MTTDITRLPAWSCASARPGTIEGPAALADAPLEWMPVSVPGTAAAALRDAGQWAAGDSRDIDADDWWFRTTFPRPRSEGPWDLQLAGLATLGDVWLNGQHLLSTSNMFRSYAVDVTPAMADENELVVRCAALAPRVAERRPRPAWKTRLVANQNLRWFRTAILGRSPSWTLSAAPVGPWRDITLRQRLPVALIERQLQVDHDGRDGIIDVRVVLEVEHPDGVEVHLTVGDVRAPLAVQADGALITATGRLRVPDAEQWWPATHGAQPLYAASLEVASPGHSTMFSLSRVGFRSLSFGPTDAPALTVNGEAIFCRGACWAPIDPIGFAPDLMRLRAALEQVRSAGMNVVRVQGSMVYESAEFLDLCDELGILVWQDLMFASLDYPVEDAGFVEDVTAEVVDVLAGLQGRPCLLAVCGGSEVAQQATMTGRALDPSPDALFGKLLGDLVGEHLPSVAYFSNSPSGGALPFTVDTGVAHYFGVGAYRRPLTDARTSGVRFATECLAFSVVPGDETMQGLEAGGVVIGDHRWKALVPRDAGCSWDFEDVRDHYVRELFDVDPIAIRDVEPDHYLDLGRAAVASVMSKTFSEWRRPESSCRGALMLQQHDLLDGAGMGLVDRHGRPKASWYALSRVLQPAALLLSDEGLNGLDLHAINDGPTAINGTLRVEAFSGANCVASAELACAVGPRSSATFRAESVLGSFLDVTYAYRFGPRSIDTVAGLWSCDGALVSRAVFVPDGAPLRPEELGLAGIVRRTGDDTFDLEITTTRLARCILIRAPGAVLSDDAFDLEPGGRVTVEARCTRPVRFEVRAVNGLSPVSLVTDDG